MTDPASLAVAKLFMIEGRKGTTDHSDSYSVDCVNPNAMEWQKVGNFDLQGRIPQHPVGVDYDMQPLRLNSNSVSDQGPKIIEDSEGR